MKTWEMIKELSENPEKKYKRIDDDLIVKRNPITGEFKWRSGHAFLNVNDDWEEVKQPVSRYEALEAMFDGKMIRCELNGKEQFYNRHDRLINIREIEYGTWYILD